ncbi:ABC transporter ATP-binding protein [Flavivirga amylovorans]|uniref:ABC transporter ATP-binding protein n=1 Tax=Flavivirga amylovorans TaxID=870486 RepID=A0ABT8X0T6_9FLAO|nr:ABC transporter ATP-binding protein [Flavivirga amylovorans]MDO5987546.1 ABC transporter ATP-binding protein [Flavivirga amylovorans]
MVNSILKVQNLTHYYGNKVAVNDISLEIKSNGVLGLLGSNGAGKSTTINILCGVLSPTKGDVFINGINIRNNQIASKKLIGFLPQKAPLYFDLTVNEYLEYCAKIRLIPNVKIRNAVERVKQLCNISHFSKALIRSLSGGYQQRVGIAQAIIHDPKLVVFDEPTNGLDPVQVLEVRKLIQTISKDRAVLLSTHILSEVQATCSNIIMIEKGNKVFSGSIEDFNNYVAPNTLSIKMILPPELEEFLLICGVEEVDFKNEIILVKTNDIIKTSKAIIERSIKSNWGLIEIFPLKNSLDDVFAELSSSIN